MQIEIVSIDRFGSSVFKESFLEYNKRLNNKVVLKEIEAKKKVSPVELKSYEADLILKEIKDDSIIVALDEHAKLLSSLDFAKQFDKWQNSGAKTLYFIIGGADGLHEKILSKAHFKISFGLMTWPHLLVRTMLIEQLYRATKILEGHPYHRE